jgi:alpha-amylase/alpha-mannosidase (GH57 family)
MNRVHLVLLWHMHQPQYRDPATGRYVLPWTRLHALKDYWGMVHVLREFPKVHATFNVVPSLGAQLEEYASGSFDEPWFDLAFRPAEGLDIKEKLEILERAFQINHENLLRRWPRFAELFDRYKQASEDSQPVEIFSLRDWRDLQLLSQLAWMDEHWLADDPLLQRLARKGANFSEEDKRELREKQLQLLHDVLPEYRRAMDSGQIEISTTPYYHPILPLICDSDSGRISNPSSPPLQPPFQHPEDAREQLRRARSYHERTFGQPPSGLWPSEGSVSDQTLELAAELGFRWFGTDEGVLGRTLGIGFGRDASGIPANAERLYSPLRVRRGEKEITGFFRDHYLSDLIGFVYSRMSATAAAEDFHYRIRAIGERVQMERPLTISVILDGENAWEYFPGNGREFLRQFYRRIESDPDIRALTASEALDAAGEISTVQSVVPGSWINANFDVWIGSPEDIAAWTLLRAARDTYDRAKNAFEQGSPQAPTEEQLANAYEALLAAEGSDWCWWYGPEHSTANDAEFDAFYRTLLTEVYLRLGREAPDELAEPIKLQPEHAQAVPPQTFLHVSVDGRETNYFEWLGAGLYSADRRLGSMHGRAYFLNALHYGFDDDQLYLRVDPVAEAAKNLRDCEFRVVIRAARELRVHVNVADGCVSGFHVEMSDVCPLGSSLHMKAAFGGILEVSIGRSLIECVGRSALSLNVSLWQGGLPVDVLPAEGWLDIRLGTDVFAWPKL